MNLICYSIILTCLAIRLHASEIELSAFGRRINDSHLIVGLIIKNISDHGLRVVTSGGVVSSDVRSGDGSVPQSLIYYSVKFETLPDGDRIIAPEAKFLPVELGVNEQTYWEFEVKSADIATTGGSVTVTYEVSLDIGRRFRCWAGRQGARLQLLK